MKNISFGLFAAEELVSASGTSIPADGLIEIISLSENGKAVIKTDLPFGSYHLEVGTNLYHICEFAELCERNGHTVEPAAKENTKSAKDKEKTR